MSDSTQHVKDWLAGWELVAKSLMALSPKERPPGDHTRDRFRDSLGYYTGEGPTDKDDVVCVRCTFEDGSFVEGYVRGFGPLFRGGPQGWGRVGSLMVWVNRKEELSRNKGRAVCALLKPINVDRSGRSGIKLALNWYGEYIAQNWDGPNIKLRNVSVIDE